MLVVNACRKTALQYKLRRNAINVETVELAYKKNPRSISRLKNGTGRRTRVLEKGYL